MFSKAVAIENLHPLQGGIWRRKYRLDRRYGLPIEPAWRFYPKATWEVVRKVSFMARYWLQLDRMRRAVQSDPDKRAYMDAALQPVDEHDVETLAMFTHNEGARSEVARDQAHPRSDAWRRARGAGGGVIPVATATAVVR